MNNVRYRSNGCLQVAHACIGDFLLNVLVGLVIALGSIIFTESSLAGSQMGGQSGLPNPPDTGTPRGHTQPGTRRPEASCRETEVPLTALVANNGSDLTISAQPTFYFYVPFEAEEIRYMEFVLLDGSERQTVYRTGVRLMNEPGIIRVRISDESEISLEAGEDYRWYFKLDCLPDQSEAPDLVVDGWVRYVRDRTFLDGDSGGITEQDYLSMMECEYWYDAISSLANLYFSSTDNERLARDWSELLNSLGYASVDEFPFVDSALSPTED